MTARQFVAIWVRVAGIALILNALPTIPFIAYSLSDSPHRWDWLGLTILAAWVSMALCMSLFPLTVTDSVLALNGLTNLFLTPRLGSFTVEARVRASWYVAHRLHEALAGPQHSIDSITSGPMDLEGPVSSLGPLSGPASLEGD